MPPSSHASDFDSDSPRFSDASSLSSSPPDFPPSEPRLRGLRWRALLGVLPACPAPIETLRRSAANGRRRYAELRRRLIVDPHTMEDVQKPDHLSVDNPLSQDPESVWGRYFRNAELERTIESDLARLYPEHGSFFQSSVCQAMLRRILLVWALIHPQYGYRQGMHEVLAPLVYVLHMDVVHLSQVRQRYEDPFEDRFDAPLEESLTFGKEGKQMVASFSSHTALLASKETTFKGDEDWLERVHAEDSALVEPDDFGFNLKTMVLGSDSYGAEGELGALLSGRFVEHDAYCMFDAVLRGQGGAVVLADYFMTVNEMGSATGLSPVLEASTAMYQALAAVDMSLYIHLVGLGVEPQFFALRWLRVLFGREFDLEKLLLLWDAVFAVPNISVTAEGHKESSDVCRSSPRGLFISSFAVSMLLYLRPTLLAAPNATTCLQKLLNFPKRADIRNLIENAKALQSFAEESVMTASPPTAKLARVFEQSRGRKHRSGSLSPPFQNHLPAANKILQHRHTASPEMVRPSLPESYWEERWMNSVLPKVLPYVYGVQNIEAGIKDTASPLEASNALGSNRLKHLKESEHSNVSSNVHSSVGTDKSTRRKLLTGVVEGAVCSMPPEDRKGDTFLSSSAAPSGSPKTVEASSKLTNTKGEVVVHDSFPHLKEEESDLIARVASYNVSSAEAGKDASTSDDLETSVCGVGDGNVAPGCCSHVQGTGGTINMEEQSSAHLPAGKCLSSCKRSGFEDVCSQSKQNDFNIEGTAKQVDSAVVRNSSDNKGSDTDSTSNHGTTDSVSIKDLDNNAKIMECKTSRTTLQTLGQSMMENIQVLETALTQRSTLSKEGAPKEKLELFSKTFLSGKGQATAVSALAELRKISNILLQI